MVCFKMCSCVAADLHDEYSNLFLGPHCSDKMTVWRLPCSEDCDTLPVFCTLKLACIY
jgi:hypothetical protein